MSVPANEPRWARMLYRLVAPIYDLIRPLWVGRQTELDLEDLLRDAIIPGARVLELAPGTGHNLKRLLNLGPRFGSYLGLDISSAMLARAQRRAPGDPRIRFLEADATRLHELQWTARSSEDGSMPLHLPQSRHARSDIPAPRFDFILSTWFLAHLDVPRETVRAALRLLAPGGTAAFLFFSEPQYLPRRMIVGIFVCLFRGRFVDAASLRELPGFTKETVYPAARLIIFRAPDETGNCSKTPLSKPSNQLLRQSTARDTQ